MKSNIDQLLLKFDKLLILYYKMQIFCDELVSLGIHVYIFT